MSAPDYYWVCHKCGSINEPGTEQCSCCYFPAVATGAEIEPSRTPEEVARIQERERQRNAKLFLFFPEIIPAGFLALIAPFWAIHLAVQGHFLGAIVVVGGIGLCAYGFFAFLLRGNKWLAYFCILAVLLLAWAVDSAVTTG